MNYYCLLFYFLYTYIIHIRQRFTCICIVNKDGSFQRFEVCTQNIVGYRSESNVKINIILGVYSSVPYKITKNSLDIDIPLWNCFIWSSFLIIPNKKQFYSLNQKSWIKAKMWCHIIYKFGIHPVAVRELNPIPLDTMWVAR